MSFYFKILFFSFIVPFLMSFDKRVMFYKKFSILLLSIPLSSIFFILWDVVFTYNNIWWFSKDYISNFTFIYLPLEEILFFFIIPFCCLFTYSILKKYRISFFSHSNWDFIHITFGILCFLISIINTSKSYTFVCFLSLSALLFFIAFSKYKIDFNLFYSHFILILIPFTIVNGALTGSYFGQKVVWYSIPEILDIHIFTIPIEDLAYCLILLLVNTLFYEYFDSEKSKKYIY